jgi:hypothetical protein
MRIILLFALVQTILIMQNQRKKMNSFRLMRSCFFLPLIVIWQINRMSLKVKTIWNESVTVHFSCMCVLFHFICRRNSRTSFLS